MKKERKSVRKEKGKGGRVKSLGLIGEEEEEEDKGEEGRDDVYHTSPRSSFSSFTPSSSSRNLPNPTSRYRHR